MRVLSDARRITIAARYLARAEELLANATAWKSGLWRAQGGGLR